MLRGKTYKIKRHFGSCKEPSKSLCRFCVCLSVCSNLNYGFLWLSIPLKMCHEFVMMCHDSLSTPKVQSIAQSEPNHSPKVHLFTIKVSSIVKTCLCKEGIYFVFLFQKFTWGNSCGNRYTYINILSLAGFLTHTLLLSPNLLFLSYLENYE